MRLPLLAASAALSWALAQSPAPSGMTIRTTTTLVQVSVSAHDAKGQAVEGLKKDDFEVFDNGKPQDIAVFAAEKAAPAPHASPLNAFPEDAVEPAAKGGGYAVILLDYLNPGLVTAMRSRLYVDRLLEQFDPAGKVAVYLLEESGVRLIGDFGADRSQMRKQLAPVVGKGVCCSGEASCASPDETRRCLLYRETTTQSALDAFADRLSFLPGRKALIWVTTGTNAADRIDYNTMFLDEDTKRVMRKLNNADVALYPVDSCGLSTPIDPCPSHYLVMGDWASQTGGVAAYHRNDLDMAMREAAEDVRFTYSLAFYPPQDGTPTDFHRLKVQVRRSGIKVSYKQGYSLEAPGTTTAASLSPPIPGAEARALTVAGASITKDLEIRAAGPSSSNVAASMLLPCFYTSANVALVNLAMEIGTAGLKFENVGGRQRAELNLVAVASRPNGGVAARFTDTVKLDFATDRDVEAFRKRPYHYEHQFRLAPGQYNIRVSFGVGEEGSGKVEMPLTVDGWDGQRLALSGVALARESRKVVDFASGLDLASIQGRKPLIARSLEIIPAGSSRFQRGEPCLAFLEIYEPLLAGPNPPKISLQIRVLDRQTGEQKADSGVFGVDNLIRAGDQVVPVSLTVPVATLSPGAYRLEVKATRSPGIDSAIRVVDFEVQ